MNLQLSTTFEIETPGCEGSFGKCKAEKKSLDPSIKKGQVNLKAHLSLSGCKMQQTMYTGWQCRNEEYFCAQKWNSCTVTSEERTSSGSGQNWVVLHITGISRS